jgi:hypothetical protein
MVQVIAPALEGTGSIGVSIFLPIPRSMIPAELRSFISCSLESPADGDIPTASSGLNLRARRVQSHPLQARAKRASNWGKVLGYAARDARILRNVIRRFERGERPIPSSIALLAWMYGEHGLPPRKSTPIEE